MPRTSDQRDDRWTDVEPTTILLRQAGDEWRATQRGVAVEGSGPTAPLAAAAYCRLIAAGADASGVDADAAAPIGDAATDSSSDGWEPTTSS